MNRSACALVSLVSNTVLIQWFGSKFIFRKSCLSDGADRAIGWAEGVREEWWILSDWLWPYYRSYSICANDRPTKSALFSYSIKKLPIRPLIIILELIQFHIKHRFYRHGDHWFRTFLRGSIKVSVNLVYSTYVIRNNFWVILHWFM